MKITQEEKSQMVQTDAVGDETSTMVRGEATLKACAATGGSSTTRYSKVRAFAMVWRRSGHKIDLETSAAAV